AYRLAGLSPCVRVDDDVLGELLRARGYRLVTPTLVLVRDLVDGTEVAEPSRPAGVHLELRPGPDEAWLDVWLGEDPARASRRGAARAIMSGAPASHLAAVGEDG